MQAKYPSFEKWVSINGRSQRSIIRYRRECAAFELASLLDSEPTVDDVMKAKRLLNRCTRWAIAQMRHDENETSTNYNKRWYMAEGERLYNRMERLNDELRAYSCGIACCGYFCQNVYHFDFNHHVIVGPSGGFLHFFD